MVFVSVLVFVFAFCVLLFIPARECVARAICLVIPGVLPRCCAVVVLGIEVEAVDVVTGLRGLRCCNT